MSGAAEDLEVAGDEVVERGPPCARFQERIVVMSSPPTDCTCDAKPAVQLADYKSWLLGVRAAMVFFDMKDSSDIPAITEPFFQKVNAAVELVPVMNQDDLRAWMATLG